MTQCRQRRASPRPAIAMSMHEPQRVPSPPTTFEEWVNEHVRLLRQADTAQPPTAPTARPTAPPPAANAAPEALPYRPIIRRPMALLLVVDDAGDGSEVIRLRGDRFVIGRTEGDLLIPHDISMASRHAQIERLPDGGWQLSDLESGPDRGTFARAANAKLKNGTVLQLGSTRFRFESLDLTEAWLVELAATGTGRRHECLAPSTLIGRTGGGCPISIDDPFVSPVHAELWRKPRSWRIENRGLNGLWVRINAPVRLSVPSEFLCGEQRFVFVPLG
jgi:pSer/pThr/pTyr-binding forkhead associated (FHA) protein